MSARRLAVIVGPTASGKSALALEFAQTFGAEIVNADSRQIYRGMEIGTAQPRSQERALLPHHLYDIVSPADTYSLALYRRDSARAFEETWGRGALPLLVGGTGQYVWALLEAWQVPEVPPDDTFRAKLTAFAKGGGTAALHARLAEVDPVSADQIDARNVRRVARALEVYAHTGRPFSEWRTHGRPDFDFQVFGIVVEREALDVRIGARTDAMFAAGFVDEVEALLAAGVPGDAPAMSSIGYAEVVRYLAGELSRDEAVEATKRGTRRLARRQAQWFRPADPRITWVRDGRELREKAESFCRAPTS